LLLVVKESKILGEQFGFLDAHQIYESIGIAQESLRTLKVNKKPSFIFKLDLSKASEKVCWASLQLMMLHVSFSCEFVDWVEGFFSSVSFSLLINGSASSFFQPTRGLRQGCTLSPLLFLMVAEGLSRCLIVET
jgi:hypothetical protein